MVKRVGICLCFFFCAVGIQAQILAGYGQPKKHAFKVNYLSPLYRSISVFYQYRYQSNRSAQVGFAYLNADLSRGRSALGRDFYEGWALTLDWRLGLKENETQGFFLQPFIRFISAHNDYAIEAETEIKSISDHVSSLGLGCAIGWQKRYRNRFIFDIYMGPVRAIPIEFYGNHSYAGYNQKRLRAPIVNGLGLRFGSSVGFLF